MGGGGGCKGKRKSLKFSVLSTAKVRAASGPFLENNLRRPQDCRYWVTLLVGIEMSFLGYRDFSIFFSVSRSSLTSNVQGRGPKHTHTRVDPRKKTISMPNNRVQNLDTKKEISIPKRRLRPSRYHKKDISIPKKKTHPSLFRGVRQFVWNHLESVSCHFCGQGFWSSVE